MNKVLEESIKNLSKYCDEEYFQDEIRGYATPNQIRDNAIEFIHGQITNLIQECRILSQNEDNRRKNLPGPTKNN